MDAALIARLIVTVGVPFVDELMQLIKSGEPVTPDKWNSLKEKIKTPMDELAGPR